MLLWSIAALATTAWASAARASVYGTLSNFDVYNETETEAHGAEIELEGVHMEDLSRTFPAHFTNELIEEYQDGATFGTRITYTDYNFTSQGYLPPTIGMSTNGHTCVNMAGCEHFGFSLRTSQPTASRFYWLDQNQQRIGAMPVAVPTPNWAFVPNPGGQPVVRAEVEIPEPPEVPIQKPDSIWMKVYKTEIDRPVDLMELMSGNAVVPEDASEVESEWELLEGGKMKAHEDEVPAGKYAVVRRYEYYEYTGQYDAENEPITLFLDPGDLLEPPAGELGQFIASNMVAANLAAPEEGDFNQDGVADGADFLAWQRGFGREGQLEDGDADWDDEIDGDDLAIWQRQFAADPAAPVQVGVPEPSAIWLALGAIVLLGRLAQPTRRDRV